MTTEPRCNDALRNAYSHDTASLAEQNKATICSRLRFVSSRGELYPFRLA